MFIYNCKFCGEVEIKTQRHAGAHVTNCPKNPNKGKSFEKFVFLGIKKTIEKRDKLIVEYNNHPKKCKNCNSIIPYNKRMNNYCGSSCSATINNKSRIGKTYILSEEGLKNLVDNGKKRRKQLTEYYHTNPDIYEAYIRKIKKFNSKPKKEFICPVCGKILLLTESEFKKRKYCGGTCRNKRNNREIYGTRSKAEVYLENKLKEEFPELVMNFNDRKLLNGMELDVYIPSLKLAIEWNGIYHYKNIRDDGFFEKVKNKDFMKMTECKKMNIHLYIIKDLTSQNKFIKDETEKIINIIKLHASLA